MMLWSEKYQSAVVASDISTLSGKFRPLSFVNAIDIRPLTNLEKNIINKFSPKLKLGSGIFLVYNDRMFRRKIIFTDKKLLEYKLTKNGIQIVEFANGKIDGIKKKRLIKANKNRIRSLKKIARSVIKYAFDEFKNSEAVISFSGGKDSIVLSHLLKKYDLTHVYIDTGMEFPETYSYIETLKKRGYKIEIIKSTTSWSTLEKKFGKPSYENRWCSKFLKFQPFKEYLEKNFGKNPVIVFSAERRWESISRINQPYIKFHKHIDNEIVVQPILDWMAIDIWIYIWKYNLPVNPLYEKIPRNGCWLCPFGWKYRKFLLKFSHPELYKKSKELE